jgi:O-antigen ligase
MTDIREREMGGGRWAVGGGSEPTVQAPLSTPHSLLSVSLWKRVIGFIFGWVKQLRPTAHRPPPTATGGRDHRGTAHSLFAILWRLTILVLPWQTRWIFSYGSLSGYSWEEGTICVYASWVLILATVAAGLFAQSGIGTRHAARGTQDAESLIAPSNVLASLGFIAIILVILSLFTSSWAATLLWWSHLVLLALFAWVLVRLRVSRQSLALWFVASLVPHAALGIQQFFAQKIYGSTLLGIAMHNGWDVGVSVVEHGLYRVLRAYGGFPHPNIFAGWLAVGLTLLPDLARRSRSKLETYFLILCSVLFSIALVFSFSRGAWAAAFIGFIATCVISLKRSPSRADAQAVWIIVCTVVACAAFGTVTQWDHVNARFVLSNRLERWSIEQRTTSLREGIDAWRTRPAVGWGPGASVVGVLALRGGVTSTSPEPPHMVPLVILLETGAVGFLVILCITCLLLRRLWKSPRCWDAIPLLVALIPLLLTDHYSWTLWAGQALVMCVALLLILRE